MNKAANFGGLVSIPYRLVGFKASNMLAASRSSAAAFIAAVRGNPSGSFCAAVCAA
jgi:hypothetical protein